MLLILCAFFMSANFSNNLIFALTFLLLGIALVSWRQTKVNLSGLTLGKWQSTPVFCGQPVSYQLRLSNPGRYSCYGLEVVADAGESSWTSVPTDETVVVELLYPTERRGYVQAKTIQLRSTFPLGLFEAQLSTAKAGQCLVYPHPSGKQPLPESSNCQQAHLRRESGSFTDMRRYAAGDSPSRIAWQALARTDVLYSKEFDGADGEAAIYLDWDAVLISDVESRLSQLCRWLVDLHLQGRDYGMRLPGVLVAPNHGEKHYRHCLRLLALYKLS